MAASHSDGVGDLVTVPVTEWRYRLHVYVDLNVSPKVVPSLLPVLRATFPFNAITHSSLTAGQHGALVSECWVQARGQLDGLKVLDVLEAQWDIADGDGNEPPQDREASAAQRTSPQPRTPPRRAAVRRERAREEAGDEKDSGAQRARPRPRGAPYHPRRKPAVVVVDDEEEEEGEEEEQDGNDEKAEDKDVKDIISDDDVPLSSRVVPQLRLTSASSSASASVPATRVRSRRRGGPRMPAGEERFAAAFRYRSLSGFAQRNVDCAHNALDLALLLTSFDAFVPGLTFVFGVARLFRVALVSTHRLALHSGAATSAFLLKECVHEVGHLFGLHHCCPPCVMAHSSSVEDAHAKEAFMCGRCKWKVGWMESGVSVDVGGPRQYRQRGEPDDMDEEEQKPRLGRRTGTEFRSVVA